ncbi:MAG: trypsin-like peptidase domain-containing protein [Saprospiraceae bacterium]|nr:trypsin-like peptidase domain-containing protein [Saprospiraceae bacterium]
MKAILQLVSVAIISALASVWFYSTYFSPQVMIPMEDRRPVQTKQAYDIDKHWNPGVQRQFLSASPTDFIEASAASTPAVVFVTSLQKMDYNFWMGDRVGQSSGSGVIISKDGYIVTNNHVVEQATEIKVLLNDNREFNADLIGTDPTTDLALLKIKARDLPYLIFGNSDSLLVGEWVLAVGNPLRLQSTVTAGIVSAKGRNINILNEQQYSIESFIQTDAVVNPGNSGGALVNTNGELIGINTAIITQSGNYEGYSFAVPSNLVQKVVADIKEFGSVQRGLLGIRIQDVTSDIAKKEDLPSIEGVYINSVFPDGAAYDAGMERGDVIVAINGNKTSTVPQLQEQIGRFRPGDQVTIDYFRNGNLRSADIILKNQVNSTELLLVRRDEILKDLGMEVRDLSQAEEERIDEVGVKVVSIDKGSIIDKTNMIPDYIITAVNGKRITSSDQLVDYLENAEGKVVLDGYYEKYQGEFPYSFYLD